MKLKGIYEKIKVWTERNLKKFDSIEDAKDLPSSLEQIKNKAIFSIKKLKEQQIVRFI